MSEEYVMKIKSPEHRRFVARARSCAFGEALLILTMHAGRPSGRTPMSLMDPLTLDVRRDTFDEVIAYVKKEFERAQKELENERGALI